ncbi:hypothetical protein O0I10_004653 [Lichtheimia ornata]|uniref:Uncharacterized protein n=1 Tax=Lichtheimia ornata TaxID=688661 RepID=A0AAD7XWH2_9FUNG|nr:uncharacterized protein O0I10_004653 [Lichtheimia ornata]KAJ8659674.1 hypothetical protein O0I10_004653 [Lichtheimia ornata]
MKATFFLAIAFLAAVVSARDITQVQQGGTGGSDNSAKGLAGVSAANGDNTILGSSEKKNEVNMNQSVNA